MEKLGCHSLLNAAALARRKLTLVSTTKNANNTACAYLFIRLSSRV